MSFKPFKKLALASAFALSFMFNSVARAEEAPVAALPAVEQTAAECKPWVANSVEIKEGCYIKGALSFDIKKFQQDGTRSYYMAPATEDNYEAKEWYHNGLLHREDGPAVEHDDGTKEWYRNGLQHREDGPAYESDRDGGMRKWYREGKLHREDGPAYEDFISDMYYRDGKLHREDGPAVIWCCDMGQEWHLNGKQLSEAEFLAATGKPIPLRLSTRLKPPTP